MRDPRLFLFFPLKVGEDQKKGLHVCKCRVFTEDQKKKTSSFFVMKPLIFCEAPYFLRGLRLQPAEPIRKSGPASSPGVGNLQNQNSRLNPVSTKYFFASKMGKRRIYPKNDIHAYLGLPF